MNLPKNEASKIHGKLLKLLDLKKEESVSSSDDKSSSSSDDKSSNSNGENSDIASDSSSDTDRDIIDKNDIFLQ